MSLRPAASHVRILTQHESFTWSANHAQVRLARLETGETTDTFNLSRVHRGVSTGDLFAEVILPCVSNAFSGQSFTFLVCGPRDSGRSVTLYGNPRYNEKGIIELTGEELLRAASAHEATITRSHFIVEGAEMHDALDLERPVAVHDFPSPVGKIPLATMVPLQQASDAVFLAPSRSRYSSVFTQLHVYTTTSKGGNCVRRTLSVITFVDVCAFTSKSDMPHDLAALTSAVHRVGTGQDARESLSACRLTQLLEGSLMGGTTLVCISAVSGHPDLYEETKETLAFAASVHKIQQVLMLVHIHTPKWVFECASHMEHVSSARQALIANSYAYGVMDCFLTKQKVIERTAVAADDVFDAAVADGNRARESITQAISAQTVMLREAIQEQQFAKDASLKEVHCMEHAAQRAMDEADALEHKAFGIEETTRSALAESQLRVDQLRAEVYDLKMKDGGRRADRVQYQRLEEDCTQAMRDYTEMYRIMTRVHATRERSFVEGLGNVERRQKKRRLEDALSDASQRVSTASANHRQNRELAAIRSRLSQMEHNVCSLRSRSASQHSPSCVVYAGPDSGTSALMSQRNRATSSSTTAQNNHSRGAVAMATVRHHVDPANAPPLHTTQENSSDYLGDGRIAQSKQYRHRVQSNAKSITPSKHHRHVGDAKKTIIDMGRGSGDEENQSIASLYLI